jgi:hypothetical protein
MLGPPTKTERVNLARPEDSFQSKRYVLSPFSVTTRTLDLSKLFATSFWRIRHQRKPEALPSWQRGSVHCPFVRRLAAHGMQRSYGAKADIAGGPRRAMAQSRCDRGSLSAPPLPHHRAYGSVHGGSRSCAN